MKRELLCLECAKKSKETFATMNYEGDKDQFTFIEGRIRANFLSCDSCNKEFNKGDYAEALSIWTKKLDYKPWEKTYLEF